ncbi:hypothetical protein C8Q74DRAFT_1369868 [Fomes fomentarius]|nr:hypothetical protein C8Q74DRAFT_1369868 [Fomes fomentarius]
MGMTATTESSQADQSSINAEIHCAERSLDELAKAPETESRADSRFARAAGSLDTLDQCVQNSSGVDLLIDGVNSLLDSLPALVKALDEISKIHPYVAVAVGAFKIVIELEVKRRDNDKKVKLLFLEMKNMMSALLQLQNVRPDHVGRDGVAVGARLESLIKETARDIKECANACDTYSKKRLLVKVLKSSSWDGKLKEYIQLFADRKHAFVFAVSIHTGMAIDHANDQLDMLISRMDVLLQYFEKAVPQEERILSTIVRSAGGTDQALKQPETMNILLVQERKFDSSSTQPTAGYRHQSITPSRTLATQTGYSPREGFTYSRAAEQSRKSRRMAEVKSRYSGPGTTPGYDAPRSSRPYQYESGPYLLPGATHTTQVEFGQGRAAELDIAEIQLLKTDLLENINTAIQKNFETFERKYEILKGEMIDEMRRIAVHEGDRVISSVLAGPHERIIDPDLYEIWKNMRWRGIVKARHLVLAIHDYYLQQIDDQRHSYQDVAARRISEDDIWAVDYLDLMHLQPLNEALDEDASGFVTIQEVNQFTTSRPQGWSLLLWLAYWTIGWQLAMTEYKSKIYIVLSSMQHLVQESARHPNKKSIQAYLSVVRPLVHQMTHTFQEDNDQLFVLPRFRAYVDQEENRLRKGLETAKYDLDALDTLALINGRRGLERSLFPLIYLLLVHHCNIIRAAEKYILHPDEMSNAEASVGMLRDAFDLRHGTLTSLFQQRRLVIFQEMTDFACGMLLAPGYRGGDEDDLTLPRISEDSPAFTEEVSTSVFKYSPHNEDFYPDSEDGLTPYTEPPSQDVDDSIRPILGLWTGLSFTFTKRSSHPRILIINLTFHASWHNPKQAVAFPKLYFPWRATRTDCITEAVTMPEGEQWYNMTITSNSSLLPQNLRLRLSADGTTLTGEHTFTVAPADENDVERDPEAQVPTSHIVFKKDSSPEIMACYPSPASLSANKTRALWGYAINATIETIRRHTLSWRVLKMRRDHRYRLASLIYRESVQKDDMPPEEHVEHDRLAARMAPADLHYIGYLAIDPQQFPALLPPCCICNRLVQTTVPCLRCIHPSCSENISIHPAYAAHGIVICDNPECLDAHRDLGWALHHPIVKTRIVGWTMDAFFQQPVHWLMRIPELQQLLADNQTQTENVLRVGWRDDPSTIPKRTEPEEVQSGNDAEQSTFVDSTEAPDAISSTRPSAGLALEGEPAFVSEPEEQDSTSTSHIEGDPVLPGATDPTRSESQPEGPQICSSCKEKVSLPCWTCTDCTDLVFLCVSCDASCPTGLSFPPSPTSDHDHGSSDWHKPTHTLLHIPAPGHTRFWRHQDTDDRGNRWYNDYNGEGGEDKEDQDDDDASGEPLGAVETHLMNLERRFETVEDGVARVERMLEGVLALLRRGDSNVQEAGSSNA